MNDAFEITPLPTGLSLSGDDAIVRVLDLEFERLFQAEALVLQIQRNIQLLKLGLKSKKLPPSLIQIYS